VQVSGSRQQCRSGPQGAQEEDAARGHFPRDETPRALRKTLRKEAREKAEAIRRARKLARKKMQREGLLPMKPRVVPGAAGGPGGPGGGGRGRGGPRVSVVWRRLGL